MNLKRFFNKKKETPSFRAGFTKKTKVQVFVRTCFYSDASAHKKRSPGFSHEGCIDNLIETLDETQAQVTFLLDTARQTGLPHFISKHSRFPVVEISEGSEAGAFLKLLQYVEEQRFDDETILYFVEDDYLHRPGWISVLKEAFTLPDVSYVTLYDHRDKYFFPQYEALTARLFHTKTCHWRTTPSTTNTYAMKWKTLKRHIDIHRIFSLNRKISADHEKFCRLSEEGATLISSLPGFASHMDPEYLSPCVNWELGRQKIKN